MYTWRVPRVSRHDLPARQVQELSQHFASLISSLHDQKQIEGFLDEFLTFEEKHMLAKRLALFIMLQQKSSPFAIQATLSLSRETVRIYKQQLPLKSNEFHYTLSRLLRMEKVKNFFISTSSVLHTVITAKTNMRSRAKIASGKWK